jgi:hypothetical protein
VERDPRRPKPIAEHQIADDGLWRIISRGLVKDANAPYQSMHALGRDLAEWLIARGVKEDICDASLPAWLDEGISTGVMNSFFRSQAPSQQRPVEPEPEVVPVLIGNPAESSGTRRIGAMFGGVLRVRRSALPKPAADAQAAPDRRWLGLTVLARRARVRRRSCVGRRWQ